MKKPHFTVLTLGLLLAMQAGAQTAASAPTSTLYEKRLAIIKGTPLPGATPPAASPPASAASGASLFQRLGAALKSSPPTGKSLNQMKKLDSPDIGIEIPTARSPALGASSAASPKPAE
jgi:hypothetical protein